MAPEQMTDLPVTPAADFYAVGTLIYVALTGKLPFDGTVLQVMSAKASRDPLPPSKLASDVPQDWDHMCRRLLDRRPEARPGASDLLSWLAADPGPFFVTQRKPRTLVGRDDMLARMFQACKRAPAVIEVTGPSGYGKSALLQTFANGLSDLYPGSLVIRGRCYEHESVPFKALDALVDDLSRHMQRMGSPVRSVLPHDVTALARLFPVLGRVEAVAGMLLSVATTIPNPAELRRRAFVAFAELLERLANKHLLVLCIDDVHWGDADSTALFEQLYGRQPVPAFVLAVSHRSTTEGEFLRLLHHHLHTAGSRVNVTSEFTGPLELAAATEIAASLLERHGINAENPEALAAGCAGNPLLLEQLIASMERPSPVGLDLRQTSVADIVLARVTHLSALAREFLQMLACVGEPLPEGIALHLPQRTDDDATAQPFSALIANLVSQKFVKLHDSRGVRELEICHDQIRAALINALPEEARRALHLRIAEALISAGYEDQGTIAVQLARGGDEHRAAVYSERAAELAETVLAFDRAAQFYGMALALGRGDGAHVPAVYERLARAYASAGRGPDSARAYEEAARLADNRDRQIELWRRAAEEWIRGGNVRRGVSLLMSLGREFRVRQTDSTIAALFSIAASRTALRFRGLTYRERRESEVPRRDLAILDLHWALTAGLSIWNPVIGTAYQLRHLRLALRAGEPRRVGLAFATEAAYLCLRGESAYLRARSLLNQSLAIARRVGDPAILGTAQAMGGMCGWLTGRWDVARDYGLEGEQTLREHCAGVSWELSIARNAALGGLLWSGSWIDYRARLSEWTRDAEDRGDVNSLSVYRMNHSPISLAADNPSQAAADLDEAERILADSWSGRGFHVPHFFGVFGRCGVALYRGTAADELEQLKRRFRPLRRSLLPRIDVIGVLADYLEAMLVLTTAAEMPFRRPAMMRKATACAASLRHRRAIWSLGMAMLVEAGIEATWGHADLAAARWDDAERELSRSGMRLYAAAAQFCRGRASGDAEVVQAASAIFSEQGIVSPAKFVKSLVPGTAM
jgi:hypothetical protein